MKLEPTQKLTADMKLAFPPPQQDTTLRWWSGAPERFYTLHVVEIVGRNNHNLTFRFRHVLDGKQIGGEHTINLDDETLAWRGLPSTVEAPNATPGQCALFFLRSRDLTESLGDDALASRRHPTTQEILETGKWPRATPDISSELQKWAKQLRRNFMDLQAEVRQPVDEKAMSERVFKLGTFKGQLDGLIQALEAP
jgi:hypothetical protein